MILHTPLRNAKSKTEEKKTGENKTKEIKKALGSDKVLCKNKINCHSIIIHKCKLTTAIVEAICDITFSARSFNNKKDFRYRKSNKKLFLSNQIFIRLLLKIKQFIYFFFFLQII